MRIIVVTDREAGQRLDKLLGKYPVSYTHLTLPTIVGV